jgi:hypothetical protein
MRGVYAASARAGRHRSTSMRCAASWRRPSGRAPPPARPPSARRASDAGGRQGRLGGEGVGHLSSEQKARAVPHGAVPAAHRDGTHPTPQDPCWEPARHRHISEGTFDRRAGSRWNMSRRIATGAYLQAGGSSLCRVAP